MESSVIKNAPLPALRGASPLLRLAPDERLIALIRRGNHAAFETLVGRYQSRLLAFCRHMVGSREDAEDVLQEVFAAAFNAILADGRPINVRPWLYRIARNRCLNQLRRHTAIGIDSMDVHFADAGQSTTEKASGREDFRLLMADIHGLPETQKTALLLREMDALSYEQIAAAMETTVPGVKSLLVRARVSLGEAAQARKLSCEQVRLELGAIAEGIGKSTAPVRRHVKDCQRCRDFRSHLRANNRVMAAALPVGPLLLLKKLALAKLGVSASAGGAGGGGAAAGAATAAGGAATVAGGVGAATTGGFGTLAAGTLAAKAVAGLAAAALVTAGAVEVRSAPVRHHSEAVAATQHVRSFEAVAPAVVASVAQPTTDDRATPVAPVKRTAAKPAVKSSVIAVAAPTQPQPAAVTTPGAATTPTVQEISNSSVLPAQPTDAGAVPPAASSPPPLVQEIVQATSSPAPPQAAAGAPQTLTVVTAPADPAATTGPTVQAAPAGSADPAAGAAPAGPADAAAGQPPATASQVILTAP